MHKAPAESRRIECLGKLSDDPKRPLGLEPPLACEQTREVGALDVAHRDVQAPLCLPSLVDGDDVRVLERGGELRLA